MGGLLSSLNPLLEKYKAEMILLSVSLVIALVSLAIFVTTLQSPKEESLEVVEEPVSQLTPESKILIDLSGSVEVPDVYEVSSGARLKDVLVLAGGLSIEADRDFFAKNFNLARIVNDQEKIYVPSQEEVLTNSSPVIETQGQVAGLENHNKENKVNLNSASIQELDSLPGIGKITAQKIIQGRPFSRIEELTEKKITNTGTFEKIKDLIFL